MPGGTGAAAWRPGHSGGFAPRGADNLVESSPAPQVQGGPPGVVLRLRADDRRPAGCGGRTASCSNSRMCVTRPSGPTAQPLRRLAKATLQWLPGSRLVHVVPLSPENAMPFGRPRRASGSARRAPRLHRRPRPGTTAAPPASTCARRRRSRPRCRCIRSSLGGPRCPRPLALFSPLKTGTRRPSGARGRRAAATGACLAARRCG